MGKSSYPVNLVFKGFYVVMERGGVTITERIDVFADWRFMLEQYLTYGCRDVFFACFDYGNL